MAGDESRRLLTSGKKLPQTECALERLFRRSSRDAGRDSLPGRPPTLDAAMKDADTLTSALAPHIAGLAGAPVDLAAALDELPLGVALLDQRFTIRLLNRALESLTGFTTEEVRGVHCRHVLRASHSPFRRSLASPVDPVDPAVGLDVETPLPAVEGDILNRHRRRVPVRLTFSRLRDARNEPAGWLQAVEDLSLVRELEARRAQGEGCGPLVGRGLAMDRIFQAIPAVAGSNAPLLITGETGTGKDAVAEAAHKASPRAREPFVKASLSALPEFLAESELFGHRQGAFPAPPKTSPAVSAWPREAPSTSPRSATCPRPSRDAC